MSKAILLDALQPGALRPYHVRMVCGHVEVRMMGPETAGVPFDPAAEWQIESQNYCVDCQCMRAAVQAAQCPPREGEMHCYHPEMYEAPAAGRLFQSRYVWKCYAIEWSADRHEEALAVLKKHRVRPKDRGPNREPIEHRIPGQNGYLGQTETYTALITSAAHDKLGPYCTHEILLD